MKLLLILAFFSSCSAVSIKSDSQSIVKVQECWNIKKLKCFKKYFGEPQKENSNSISYFTNDKEFLTIFIDKNEHKILGAQYWIYDSSLNIDTIKKILISDDWALEKLPETNPHVVNLAVANYSKKLGASFLTYQLDTLRPIRAIYWGGDYKNIQF